MVHNLNQIYPTDLEIQTMANLLTQETYVSIEYLQMYHIWHHLGGEWPELFWYLCNLLCFMPLFPKKHLLYVQFCYLLHILLVFKVCISLCAERVYVILCTLLVYILVFDSWLACLLYVFKILFNMELETVWV